MNSTTAQSSYSPVDAYQPMHFTRTEPVQPVKAECCPQCQSANQGANTLYRLQRGLLQLVAAVTVILFSVLRLARLFAAAVFTLIGLIGSGLYIAGQYIVHPDDRRLLPRMPRSNRE